MADDGEEVDRSKGGQGTHLTMATRLAIAQRVAAARLSPKPVPWAKLAEQEGVSSEALRVIFREYQQGIELTDDPVKAVEESLALYTAAVKKFAYEAEYATNSSARVGATRSMLEAVKGRLELMAAIGKLPRDLGAAQDAKDVTRMIMQFAEIVERHDLPQEVIEDLLSIVESGPTTGKPILKLEAGG